MLFFRKRLAQIMVAIIDAILLEDRGEVSEMFKRLVPQNQDRHFATLALVS
jgi:hypothetical protein